MSETAILGCIIDRIVIIDGEKLPMDQPSKTDGGFVHRTERSVGNQRLGPAAAWLFAKDDSG
jgi:hypothetical protein